MWTVSLATRILIGSRNILEGKSMNILKKMRIRWAVKRKVRRLKRSFLAVFRRYQCHVCKNGKRVWKMRKCNTVNPTASSNICHNCWSFTDEEPFFFCEVCLTSKPYDRMIQTGKRSWICTNCDNPSGASVSPSGSRKADFYG